MLYTNKSRVTSEDTCSGNFSCHQEELLFLTAGNCMRGDSSVTEIHILMVHGTCNNDGLVLNCQHKRSGESFTSCNSSTRATIRVYDRINGKCGNASRGAWRILGESSVFDLLKALTVPSLHTTLAWTAMSVKVFYLQNPALKDVCTMVLPPLHQVQSYIAANNWMFIPMHVFSPRSCWGTEFHLHSTPNFFW